MQPVPYQFASLKYICLLCILLSKPYLVHTRPHGSTEVEMADSSNKEKGPSLINKYSDIVVKKRTSSEVDFNDFSNDIISYVDYTSGSSDSDIFDMRRQDTLFCNLCIWIQPNYAVQHGFGSLSAGVSETLQLVKLLSWIFRALDINLDTVPDSIAFIVGQVLVQDLKLPLTSCCGDANISATSSGRTLKYSNKIGTVNPTTMLTFLEKSLPSRFPKQKCCATLSFMYHDIPKVLSFTSLRGLCSSHNVAVISGYHTGGKISFHDVFRATFHALAHLLGANHDDRLDEDCFDKKVSQFLNPFVMEQDHHLNVGLRPNSMKLSYCSKSQMAVFLTSNLFTCLTSRRDGPFCGNGVVEEGEDCDCGALWQCQLGDRCCEPRDSFSPCKVNKVVHSLKSGKCMRPTEW